MGAPRTSPDEQVYAAVIARLRGASAVTTIATGGVYSEVPQTALPPYAKVTVPVGSRLDTCGRFGANTVVDVDCVISGESQTAGVRLRSAVITALDNVKPSMVGHVALGTSLEGTAYFHEIVNGVKHHHHVATCRVWTEQAA